ncbi:hypothetical protein C8R45DRAFT_907306 [Mycena sanguinolenta]|nr:hypothetical protein C8R45DRAFT_907306 [Mycena sanguinolenta]
MPTTTAGAAVAFRKDFTPPLGKILIGAEVIMAAASNFNFYVNGGFVGSGADGPGIAQRFCVALEPSYNVFAVNASITASGLFSHGGLLATILVTYSDFTTDTILSNGTFRISSGSPAGFEQLSFNDTTWIGASVVGTYGNANWGTVSIPSNPPVLDLASSYWVFAAADFNAAGAWLDLPRGPRAFRRTFTPAPGQIPSNANILITSDYQYTLYVNGVQVGTGATGPLWTRRAQHYVVNFASAPTKIVVAVLVTNTGPAALLLSMEVNMAPTIASPATRGQGNCTAGAYVVSDNSWLSMTGAIPTGFQQLGFDGSAWPAALQLGGVGAISVNIDPPELITI